MVNNTLFSSANANVPRANTFNEAGGQAYQMEPKQALAQLAATGTFNSVYYTSAAAQLDSVRDLIGRIDDNAFLAKLALYSRRNAFMKDMPAAILVALSNRDTNLTHQIFDRIVDNGRILRTVFQMVRSGQFGRKGLSSSLKRAFQRWLNEASVPKLLSASIGNDPSLRDILRMARPKPKDNTRRALFGWLTGKDVEIWRPATGKDLPSEVQNLITYRQSTCEQEQAAIVSQMSVRWDLLADAALGPAVWSAIARKMGPQALRMNLNTLNRHGVFEESNQGIISKIAQAIGFSESTDSITDYVAEKIGCVDDIIRSRQFPYQFLAAYQNANPSIPQKISDALQFAAEVACGQVPVLPGPVLVGVDTSGSMSMPTTGHRHKSVSSKMRCVDVAALFASAIVRRNPNSLIVPFDTHAYDVNLSENESILGCATRLTKYGGGGTNCSLPLQKANSTYSNRQFAGIVIISDNQSWVGVGRHGGTRVMQNWDEFATNQRRLNAGSNPKLVCIDIQPYVTAQAPERNDILNIGGFSDAVFKVVAGFMQEKGFRFVNEIEAIEV